MLGYWFEASVSRSAKRDKLDNFLPFVSSTSRVAMFCGHKLEDLEDWVLILIYEALERLHKNTSKIRGCLRVIPKELSGTYQPHSGFTISCDPIRSELLDDQVDARYFCRHRRPGYGAGR